LAFVADFETLNFHLKNKFDMKNETSTNHENGNDANRLLAAVYSEQEKKKIREGWCVAYNTWWKHKDGGLDFREMETKLIEALENALLNGC
jgi:hypothetical protein